MRLRDFLPDAHGSLHAVKSDHSLKTHSPILGKRVSKIELTKTTQLVLTLVIKNANITDYLHNITVSSLVPNFKLI